MKNPKFLVYAGGIFACYFYFGILQEQITRGEYGPDKEKFKCILGLVFVQCVVNYIFAKIVLAAKPQGEDTTQIKYYASSSLTYLLAMVTSNMALQWVNYPTQVIAKSGKPIPVMILGVLLGRKSYPLKKYIFVLLIVTGVAMFMYKDKKSASNDSTFGFGELLLILSLTMDGLTGAIQERMRHESQTRSGHMMVNMNKWSVFYLGIGILITGELVDFITFVGRYPTIIWRLMMISIASALGQFFIFLTVSEFGPLPCSIITTTRKFFTVLGSVFLFGNALILRQWIATIVVFSGLTLDAMFGKSSSKVPIRK
nr:PREDICTED: solute carrier family 35 member B1 [Bemisia tabaci]